MIEDIFIKLKLSEEYTIWLYRKGENAIYREEDSFSNNADTAVNWHVDAGV
jgi:hypothetical protein